jgi:hypothetical protein
MLLAELRMLIVHVPEPGMPLTAIMSRWLRGVSWNFFHALSTRWFTWSSMLGV